MLIGALTEYAANFYRYMNDKFDDNEDIILYNEDVHRPESCKRKSQKLLIFIYLYAH